MTDSHDGGTEPRQHDLSDFDIDRLCFEVLGADELGCSTLIAFRKAAHAIADPLLAKIAELEAEADARREEIDGAHERAEWAIEDTIEMRTERDALRTQLAEAQRGLTVLRNIMDVADEESRQAAPQVQPVAWAHPDGRVIPASTMDGARKDGGAILSTLRGHTIPLYAAPPQPLDVQERQDRAVASHAGRSVTDYALEHADYLAQGAEDFLEAVNDYFGSCDDACRLDGDASDDDHAAADERINRAENVLNEHLRGLRSDVHEFRKRRARVATPSARDCDSTTERATSIEAKQLREALTEDGWLDLAQRHVNADWNSDQPDGYLNAVKALVRDAIDSALSGTEETNHD